MDTVHSGAAPTNMDNKETVLTRKEIRRQKLMEYLAAKANLTLPSKKPNMGKDEVVKRDRSAVKVVMDKENKIPTLNKDTKDKMVQSTYSVKRPLGLKNTANISCNKLSAKQNSKNTSTLNKEPKAHQIPTFTRTYTIVNPKPSLNAASQKPPFTKVQSANTQATKAANKTTSASTNVKKTIDGRMIHGPIVKTRTGLMPAVVQPRSLKSHIFTSASDAKTSTNKAQSSITSHRLASQASNRSLKKTSAVLKPAGVGTVAMMERERNKPQNKCPTASSIKHLQHKQNNKLSDGPHLSARCTSKSLRPDSTVRTTATNGNSHYQSQAKINTHKPCKGKSAKTITSTQDSFKVNKTSAACSGGSGKSMDSKETQKKITAPSSKPICAAFASKQRKMPLVAQTAPQPPRTQNFINKPTGMKTPLGRAPPQTFQKTLTAADERIKKLQEWRESKGISYKRPPMFVKTQARRTIAVPQPFWSNMEQEDEAHSLICAVDRSLADCIKLLGEGCPTHQVKEVLSRLPEISQKFAKYWICQARLMEREGNLDVLPLFEKAVGLVLEPVDELRTVVFDILKKRDENHDDDDEEAEETADASETSPDTMNDPTNTPKPTRALICAEKGNSSVVKYKITATPGCTPSQRRESTVVNGQDVRFFTPVRRSVRIEKATLRYPVSLQDHDLCVASYNDLLAEEEKETVKQRDCASTVTKTPLYIYRENEALKDKVSVECVSNDE